MLNNLNEQAPVECMSLEEAQAIFEQAVNGAAEFDSMEISHSLDFKHKDRNGQYMCCTTLEVFKLFTIGITAGFDLGVAACNTNQ